MSGIEAPIRPAVAKAGTKQLVMAPSPTRQRKRLGMMSAMRKASEASPVPRKRAWVFSGSRPEMRLRKVMAPTEKAELIRWPCSERREKEEAKQYRRKPYLRPIRIF